jgi:hypothetical protein
VGATIPVPSKYLVVETFQYQRSIVNWIEHKSSTKEVSCSGTSSARRRNNIIQWEASRTHDAEVHHWKSGRASCISSERKSGRWKSESAGVMEGSEE